MCVVCVCLCMGGVCVCMCEVVCFCVFASAACMVVPKTLKYNTLEWLGGVKMSVHVCKCVRAWCMRVLTCVRACVRACVCSCVQA